MKIAIIGTRGIPNCYGGFEQVSEYLSEGLVRRGHDVSVYCSHSHPYKNNIWNGVSLIHCFDAEKHLKTAGQFLYDLNCIRDARKRNFDVLLFMGYTSSSIWGPWFPPKTVVISNMDGLEWKRQKYSGPVRRFLKHAEKLAVRHSHFHIADSVGIRKHFETEYNISPEYIPYGAKEITPADDSIETGFNSTEYFLIIARMEPENNIEMVLDGFTQVEQDKEMIVVGNTKTPFGRKMTRKFRHNKKIKFTGPVFEMKKLEYLRKNCQVYFHGHSVGGTNPSLLEAMACGALVAAHENIFNRSILENDAFYFNNASEVASIMASLDKKNYRDLIENNLRKIATTYNWEKIVDQYEIFIMNCFQKHRP